ncbi:MAG: phage tail family protein [Clostridium sp.]
MIEIKNITTNKSMFFSSKGNYILNIEDLGAIGATHNTTKALGQNGEYLTSTVLESRDIPITGYILAESKQEMDIRKMELIELINPLQDIYLIKEKYKISCRPVSTVKFSTDYKENNDNVCKFIVVFFCANPFWSKLDDIKNEIALWKGSFKFPLVIPQNTGIIMGYKEPSLIVNINNDGSIEAGMIIEFKARGTLTNPSLFNVNTRQWIKIEKEMIAGEIIKINTNFGKKRVEQILNGGTYNGFKYLKRGSTFLQLFKGDNLFRYDADSSLDNLEVAIYYNPNYLGVV